MISFLHRKAEARFTPKVASNLASIHHLAHRT
jgi:hypothetical protein